MITQITDLILFIVLKIVNKLFIQKTSFPFNYSLSLEFFLKILRFYRLHEACYGGFSLIRVIVLIFLLATVAADDARALYRSVRYCQLG